MAHAEEARLGQILLVGSGLDLAGWGDSMDGDVRKSEWARTWKRKWMVWWMERLDVVRGDPVGCDQ